MNEHEYEETLRQVARNLVLTEAKLESLQHVPDISNNRATLNSVRDVATTLHSQKQWVMTVLRDNWPERYHDFCLEMHGIWNSHFGDSS